MIDGFLEDLILNTVTVWYQILSEKVNIFATK